MAQTLGTFGNELNLKFRQGATLGPYNLTITDAEGAPKNLTGYTFSATVRKSYTTSNILATIAIIPVDLPNGKIKFLIPNTVTATIPGAGEDVAEYVWDMEYTDDQGVTEPIYYGKVLVKTNV